MTKFRVKKHNTILINKIINRKCSNNLLIAIRLVMYNQLILMIRIKFTNLQIIFKIAMCIRLYKSQLMVHNHIVQAQLLLDTSCQNPLGIYTLAKQTKEQKQFRLDQLRNPKNSFQYLNQTPQVLTLIIMILKYQRAY